MTNKCKECGGLGRICMAGRSAHESNWYPCDACSGIASHSAEPLGVEPVVERRPVAEVASGYSGDPDSRGSKILKWLNPQAFQIGTKLYAAPPELTELQATITRLESEAVYAAAGFQAAQEEIERLKGVSREPVYFANNAELSVGSEMPTVERLKTGYCTVPLYTSLPAPISVALPERKEALNVLGSQFDDGQCDGWNACLDNVKELNAL